MLQRGYGKFTPNASPAVNQSTGSEQRLEEISRTLRHIRWMLIATTVLSTITVIKVYFF